MPDRGPQDWRLEVSGEGRTIELSRASPLLACLSRFGIASGYTTLKIRPDAVRSSDRIDVVISEIARDFLLELDLKYHVDLRLRMAPKPIFAVERRPSKTEVSFPRNAYSSQAQSLYWYAASAEGLPLLQFLAYYQVLEFFFSSFTRERVIQRLRTQLRDPSFSPDDPSSMSQLVDLSADAHRGFTGELEQLRMALEACSNEASVRQFLKTDERLLEHFTSRKQKIAGTTKIDIDRMDSMIEQIAERVYAIRCRIVHTKQSAEDRGLQLLLPSSDETAYLGAEIALVKWLAQRALIHGATSR